MVDAYQLFPDLADEEYTALKADIAEHTDCPLDGVIYFLQASTGEIKIGWTGRRTCARRIAEIQPMSPVPLRLLGHAQGCRTCERLLHRLCSDWQVHGEWFRPHHLLVELAYEFRP